MSTQTLLIGLDGATFSVLDPLVADGHMPTLAQLINEGVSGKLQTIVPALTPPAWTSLVTGVSPGQHGIFDFFRKEKVDSYHLRFMTARDIKAPGSIWSIAHQHNNRVIALNFPLTFPAPKVDGYVIPGWMPWKQLRLGCWPRDFYKQLQELPEFNPRELAMDMAFEEKALEGCPEDEYLDWIALHVRREQQWLAIIEMLLTRNPSCELITILFDGVDKLQHLFWRYIHPSYAETWVTEQDIAVRNACVAYFEALDGVIGRLLDRLGDDVTVIVASDHGFGAQVRTFFVNSWLAREGYLVWARDDVPRRSQEQQLGVGHIARHAYMIDWTQTKAYAPLPSGNGIHVVRRSDSFPAGIIDAEYDTFCAALSDKLRGLRDPHGRPVVADVKHRNEIFAGPDCDLAPDLTLILADGGLISILASDDIVMMRPEPVGTHHQDGVLIAHGP